MRLAIGCPVAHREWILRDWFNHVEAACAWADVEPHYVFVGDCGNDRSFEVIYQRAPEATLAYAANTKGWDTRDWATQGRFAEMVGLRNQLLDVVRHLAPEVFLSLDSDILIHPMLIDSLLQDLADGKYAAVGGRCYMSEGGREFPSWANMSRENSLIRYDSDGYFACDVIMAIKAMSPAAYAVDYENHAQGEDVGWSLACGRAGLKLGWDGRLVNKHVMAPHLRHLVDPRVGF